MKEDVEVLIGIINKADNECKEVFVKAEHNILCKVVPLLETIVKFDMIEDKLCDLSKMDKEERIKHDSDINNRKEKYINLLEKLHLKQFLYIYEYERSYSKTLELPKIKLFLDGVKMGELMRK